MELNEDTDRYRYDHAILMCNSPDDRAMCFGHTVVVTESGCEALSRKPLELVNK